MTFEDMLAAAGAGGPYAPDKAAKERLLTARLQELTAHHQKNCPAYRDILQTVGYDAAAVRSCADIPFLPVRLFKEMTLKSVADGEVVKTMTSSGTTGQRVSKIYLDRATAANQQKTMVKIVNDFTGSGRMPMIIVDCPSVVKDRAMFSARGAGILGFSIFGSKKFYALDDDMRLDVDGLREFLAQHRGETVFLFGFTFMVWQYFYKELVRLREQGVTFDLSGGILIHGGGWKKLAGEAVSRGEFHARLQDVCGLARIHDYYGMVEQTGCIYMECECGHLHASVFSDVLVRRPGDFGVCDVGEEGILQVLSALPESYPGHSLLTEDTGVLLGEDDCPCGRKGKYFKVTGRLKNAELRGCSDTFAAEHGAPAGAAAPAAGAAGGDGLDGVQFLLGDAQTVRRMPALAPLPPFGEPTVEFLNEVSRQLLADRAARAWPDVVTLGFWLRKASVLSMRERFLAGRTGLLLGRGAAFHIAPSNVPVNYAYSLFAGLLCGNANIVRVPSKDFAQIALIDRAIAAALEKHPAMAARIALVRYGREQRINNVFSALCDVRIVWGGDATIAELRRSPLPPRATEVTFADRYSLAVLDAGRYMALTGGDAAGQAAARIAADFYNDTYLTDQNACTSPRAVVWLGAANARAAAKACFWEALYRQVREKYALQPIQAVDKLATVCQACAAGLGRMTRVLTPDNRLVRVQVTELPAALMDYRGNSGYFYEYDCDDILALRDFCADTRCQTVGLLGDAALLDPLLRAGIKGVDRVVPLGRTMDFDLLWDGYDLVERLTRTVRLPG